MRGEKPKYPGENLSEQSREPTNAVHIWRRMQKLNAASALTTRPTLTPISIKTLWLLIVTIQKQKEPDFTVVQPPGLFG